MKKIAFYAPLKPPDHPVPSGDRTVARLLMLALRRAGFEVEVATKLRARIARPEPDAIAALRRKAEGTADRLIAKWKRKKDRPAAWFTYHLYYKAVDWIGPRVSAALEIPYLVAEASHAPKRAGGPWSANHAGAVKAIKAAKAIFCLNPSDKICLSDLVSERRLVDLPPFLDLANFAPLRPERELMRKVLAKRHDFDPKRPWLLAVGMMRAGDKLASYQILSSALRQAELPQARSKQPVLILIGDGLARVAVEQSFEDAPCEVHFLGSLHPELLPQYYGAADLMVWPAINEAFGMALLEAQACGLPVLAGNSGGVSAIVQDGKTGFLTNPGDAGAFALGLRKAMDSDLAAMSLAARNKVEQSHDLGSASEIISKRLARLGIKP